MSHFVKSVQRVDVVFGDQYRDASLKAAIRRKMGTGMHIAVEGRTPGNWRQFLPEDGNKAELFNLLSDNVNVTTETLPGELVMTRAVPLHMWRSRHLDATTCCQQYQARMQENPSIKNCWHRCCTRCQYHQQTDKWTVHCVIYWNGKTFRYLDTTHIAQKLGNDKRHLLPAFQALRGCDTTSGFAGRGKRTASSVWSKFKDVTPLYLQLPKHQQQHTQMRSFLPSRDSSFWCMT